VLIGATSTKAAPSGVGVKVGIGVRVGANWPEEPELPSISDNPQPKEARVRIIGKAKINS
jgi:hypothetical protein